MTELVQLERRHEDFGRRDTRVLVASMEGLDDAKLRELQGVIRQQLRIRDYP